MKTSRPSILITNDDGVHAPGIRYLHQALTDYADIAIVAPASEQSAVGLSTTLRQPLLISKLDWGSNHVVWSVTGTPADCVKMALSTLLPSPPCMVVSGINRGGNSGRNVLYSGTVGATIESVMQGIPGIAFSCRDYDNPNYSAVLNYIPLIVDHVLNNPLPPCTLLNVNFPESSLGDIKGIKLTRQGKEYWGEKPVKREHPSEGNTYYWLGSRRINEEKEEEDCDVMWLQKGYVAAVPVHIGDLTDVKHLEASKSRFENLLPSRVC